MLNMHSDIADGNVQDPSGDAAEILQDPNRK